MTDKILESVKALGGYISNTWHYKGDESLLALCDDGDYLCVYDEDEIFSDAKYICTISEFNTAAAEWLKEAYMHNAAIDLGWELKEKPRGAPTVVCTGICTMQEFIDYCEANKPAALVVAELAGEAVGNAYAEALDGINNGDVKQKEIMPPTPEPYPDFVRSEESPVFTQAMADAGELPPVGSECLARCTDKHEFIKCKIIFASDVVCLVKILDDSVANDFIAITGIAFVAVAPNASNFKPIQSPRDKAVEASKGSISLRARDGANEVANEVYDWLKQLTPEQRTEFDL